MSRVAGPLAALATLGAGCALALAAALVRRRYVVVTVEGASMMPTLADGDRVVVRRTRLAAVRTGQLVVSGPPSGARWSRAPLPAWLVKRAVAVPGDRVPKEAGPALVNLAEDRVPEGRLVLLGDNPARSLDSRHCGYFGADQLLGVVVRRLPGAGRPAHRPPPPPGRDGRAVPGRTDPSWGT